MKSLTKKKSIARPASKAEIKAQKCACIVQLVILLCLMFYILLDTFLNLNGSLFVSLLIFGGSFLVKKLLEKYILPRIFEKSEVTKN